MVLELQDLKARHASAPLFSDDLARQLKEYEARTAHMRHQSLMTVDRPVGVTKSLIFPSSSVLTPRRQYGADHPTTVTREGSRLPPEVVRPPAVEWLLGNNPSYAATGARSLPQHTSAATRGSSRRSRSRRRHASHIATPLLDAHDASLSGDSSNNDIKPAHAALNASKPSAHSADDAERRTRRGAENVGDAARPSMALSVPDEAEDECDRSKRSDSPADWVWQRLERLDDNIARAAARRDIQEAQLRAKGIAPPQLKTARTGTQTDMRADAPSHPSAMSNPDTRGAAAAVDSAAMQPANITPSQQPYMLLPVGQLQPPRVDASSAVKPPFSVDRNGDALDAAREAIRSKLDVLQLANEELMVTHGAAGDSADHHEHAYQAALHHVAEAHQRPPDGNRAFAAGLDNVAVDPKGREKAAEEASAERRRAAKRQAIAAASIPDGLSLPEALRRYASESEAAAQRRAAPKEILTRRLRDPYDARRKWADVTFGIPGEADHDHEYRVEIARTASDDSVPHYGFMSARTAPLEDIHDVARRNYPTAALNQ